VDTFRCHEMWGIWLDKEQLAFQAGLLLHGVGWLAGWLVG
jgi:hypothetical protein